MGPATRWVISTPNSPSAAAIITVTPTTSQSLAASPWASWPRSQREGPSTRSLSTAGCKGDPKTPEYWDKAIGNVARAKDKARVVEDLRAANLAGPAFVPMLLQHLSAEKQPEVKEVLAKTLGGLKDPQAVDPLIG